MKRTIERGARAARRPTVTPRFIVGPDFEGAFAEMKRKLEDATIGVEGLPAPKKAGRPKLHFGKSTAGNVAR